MDLYEILKQMIKEKEDKRMFPCHILVNELSNRLGYFPKEELNTLFKEGKITICKTLNSKAICLNTKENLKAV